MKRDMDLCRKILFAMEENSQRYPEVKTIGEMVDDVEPDVVQYHCHIMAQAGLLIENIRERTQKMPANLNPGPQGIEYVEVHVGTDCYYSLSWDGHEFLDQARDDTNWEKAKKAVAGAGTCGFAMLKAALASGLTKVVTENVNALF